MREGVASANALELFPRLTRAFRPRKEEEEEKKEEDDDEGGDSKDKVEPEQHDSDEMDADI